MKARFYFSLILVVMLVTAWATPVALSQDIRRGAASFYNPSTETTVKGTVEQVQTAYLPGVGASQQSKQKFTGPIYLNLKAESGMLKVYLGPSWFIESKGFKFEKGDLVEVTGSKFHDQHTIIAREVKKSDQVLVLRNAQGIPEWSRGQ